MKSERINKEGEGIPSVLIDQYNYNPYAFENWRERNVPFQRNDMGIMGGCANDLDDERWLNPNRRSHSVLTDSTTMGKPVNERLAEAVAKAKEIRISIGERHDQDGLNRFLVQMNRFAPGDYITFANYPSNGNMVTWTTIGYILSVDRLIEECVWPDKESAPKPFLLLDLSPMLPQYDKSKFSGRFVNMLYSRHLTHDEATKFTRNNVQLQNYIEQAKAAAKTGLLPITG